MGFPMNSRVLSFYLLFSIAFSGSVCQASNFGLKSRSIIGLFAAGGSALATGAAMIADSFKKDELSTARLKIAQLENELNCQYVKQIMNEEYTSGIIVGVVGTLFAGVLLAIACAPNSSRQVTDEELNLETGMPLINDNQNINDKNSNVTDSVIKA